MQQHVLHLAWVFLERSYSTELSTTQVKCSLLLHWLYPAHLISLQEVRHDDVPDALRPDRIQLLYSIVCQLGAQDLLSSNDQPGQAQEITMDWKKQLCPWILHPQLLYHGTLLRRSPTRRWTAWPLPHRWVSCLVAIATEDCWFLISNDVFIWAECVGSFMQHGSIISVGLFYWTSRYSIWYCTALCVQE